MTLGMMLEENDLLSDHAFDGQSGIDCFISHF
jgi:hypothetical protein